MLIFAFQTFLSSFRLISLPFCAPVHVPIFLSVSFFFPLPLSRSFISNVIHDISCPTFRLSCSPPCICLSFLVCLLSFLYNSAYLQFLLSCLHTLVLYFLTNLITSLYMFVPLCLPPFPSTSFTLTDSPLHLQM